MSASVRSLRKKCSKDTLPAIKIGKQLRKKKEVTGSRNYSCPFFKRAIEVEKENEKPEFEKVLISAGGVKSEFTIILRYEGVIGDYYKENFWDNQPYSLFMRKGVEKGLRKLQKQFYLILLIPDHSVYDKVLSYFCLKSIFFNAVYKCANRNKQFSDYTPILEENMRSQSIEHLLIITSSYLEYPDYCESTGADLVKRDGFKLLW